MPKVVRLFTIDDDVEAKLKLLEWGEISKFVNECVRCNAGAAEANLEKTVHFRVGSNDSKDSHEQQMSSSESNKPSKKPAASAAKPTEKSKQHTKRTSTLFSLLGGN